MRLRVSEEPSDELGAVAWLREADLPGTGRGVASFVPEGFERYARILHPARVEGRRATWADIAAWSARTLAPDSDSKELMRRADGEHWDTQSGHQRPSEGTAGLDEDGQIRLAELLAAATSTPDRLWLLLDVIQYHVPSPSSGYTAGGPRARRRRLRSTRAAEGENLRRMRELEGRCGAEIAGHRFVLHRGGLARDARPPATTFPSYWWPEDRAWLVHTDVDCPTTYVGGAADLVEALLGDDVLEVVEARLDHLYDGHHV